MKIIKAMLCYLMPLMFLPQAQARDLRLGLITPPTHQWTKAAEAFAADLGNQSNGRLKVMIFPSGQLGNEAQMLQQLQTGALDMAFLTAGEMANRRPDFAALFAPYLIKTPQQAQQLLQGKTASQMLDELNSLGLVGLGYSMAGLRQIVMKNEVKTVADLQGTKVRTIPIEPERDFWIKVGAAPTPIPLPALYDAFANGQVDGMQIDFEGTWNTRYLDYAGTIIHSSHMMLPMVGVASGRSWKSLDNKDRELISSLAKQHLNDVFSIYEKLDQDYLKKIQDSGARILEVDRSFFGSAVDQWYKEWRIKAPSLPKLEAEAATL
ncbi:TRAP transporter substrate-binding protein [Oceanobacter mangrovi]|uniref:TRAP transporter substrate-binding protein n=1 Tax=Oceanobacter mangrovi TaxID=2862510 RepID=UPI001C8E9247|nr:TRAP transporter substrate-binding protein [Oceanobacter mangrovi]